MPGGLKGATVNGRDAELQGETVVVPTGSVRRFEIVGRM
jgi:hypothetical protein